MSSMTPTPTGDLGETDPETDRRQDAMKDQLRKDVASWSAARSADAPGLATHSPPAVKPPPVRATRPKVKAAKVVDVVPAEKKPFKMSYDGTTDRDYIAQRIKLGAR
jgi:hypothetical protein